jgi:hypothetical protein
VKGADFYHPVGLTEHTANIVPVCSVNSEIHANFALTVIPGIGKHGRKGHPAETRIIWKVLTAAEAASRDKSGHILISYNLFEEEEPSGNDSSASLT